ncbi:MAG: response regulator [Oceanospirillaceae bacterium]|nr:response regulator [Oceanospirillaceae bacterium]
MMLNSDKKMIDAYYHPTTVVFLDDHQAFLNSIPLALEANVAYKPFIDPKAAINYINGRTQYQPLVEKDDSWADNHVSYHYKLNVESILNKTHDGQRFSEPSILVTDYAMPSHDYNGLDVCKAIDNPYVKKILLTGVADEQIAIEALNNKVIDYYLKKSTQNVFTQVNQLIHRYQQEYFHDMTRVIRESLKVSCPLIDDPEIVAYFFAIIEQENIVEYHLNIESKAASLDFLMVDEQGKSHRLLILNQDDLRAHRDVATDVNAPEALLDALQNQTKVPLFSSTDGFYHPDMQTNWEKYLHSSTRIDGRESYIASFISEVDINPTLTNTTRIFSFLQYLQNDTSAGSLT